MYIPEVSISDVVRTTFKLLTACMNATKAARCHDAKKLREMACMQSDNISKMF